MQIPEIKYTKICKRCNICKPIDLFYKSKSCKGGVEVNCKECRSIYKKSTEGKRKDKAYKRKGKEYSLWLQAKKRANEKGLEFNITKEDIVIPHICPVLGIPISRDGSCKYMYNSPSLDRVDNTKGYVKGNICVISWKANTIKSMGSIEEHQKVIEYMRSFIETSS